ncbi:MAG TPA: 16S rRNA (cytosine(967)-C(5))-methyltransferase RsmB [bacterium]|nr:16S rRNA (cytosine(967)-C(5))-methyltransferase RsmB [bacterium]
MSRTYRKSSPARSGALTVLEEVLTHGKTLLDGLPLLDPACSDPRDLALAREIVSGTCRWLGRVQYVLRHYAARLDQFPPIVQRILELSVYQLLFLDRVPPYAVLSDAVELARERKVPGLAAAVNAILRKVVQEKESHGRVDSTGLDPERFLEAEYSHPAWLVKRWREIWPEEMVDSLCRFNNTRAPLSLRAREDVEAALSELRRRNLPAELDSRVPGCMMIDFPGSAPAGLFDLDLWVAQDGAAMLIAPLVDPQPGWRIWDVCAAPGGKTLHLAGLAGNQAEIVATDVNPSRVDRLRDQVKKNGNRGITVLELDALRQNPPREGGRFDAILVDAPCSGWGTFRRHPDLRWRLQPGDMVRFGTQAARLLERVQRRLKPGGVLVYSTCTLSPEENEDVVTGFLRSHPEFTLEPVDAWLPPAMAKAMNPGGCLEVFPPVWNLDGAYAARLRKKRDIMERGPRR